MMLVPKASNRDGANGHARFLSILLLAATALWSRAADERWLTYGQQVTLQGTLLKLYHTEWIDLQGDTPQARELAKTPAYLLRLRSPFSVRAGGITQEEERKVREIFLMLPSETSDKRIAPLVNKTVTVVGQLDHATTVHHQRPVMMDVTSIQ